MGQTLSNLAKRRLGKAVFNNRFVIEICEKVHVHYRDLRLVLSLEDWIKIAESFKNSLERWTKLGKPECSAGEHIEITRKNISVDEFNNDIVINLNKNLYKANEGRIFSEGAEISDEEYIHLKIRDYRIELSKKDFLEVADAFIEAKRKIENRDSDSDLRSA